MPKDKISTRDHVHAELIKGPRRRRTAPECPKCGGQSSRKPGAIAVYLCVSCDHEFTLFN